MTVEAIGGYLANSMAIMSDACHLLSDILGFIISILSLYYSQKNSSFGYTFGYARIEIIGALFTLMLTWGITIFLIFEAIERSSSGHYEIDQQIMLYTAIFGVFCNGLMGFILMYNSESANVIHMHGNCSHGHHHKHSHNHSHKKPCNGILIENSQKEKQKKYEALQKKIKTANMNARENANFKASLLHILGDMLLSIAVIISAIIIYYYPDYKWVDTACTCLFAFLVFCTSVPFFIDCLNIIMEGLPKNICLKELLLKIRNLGEVQEVHDVHLWNISIGKPCFTAHIISENPEKDITVICRKSGIYHTTIQIEKNNSDIKCKHNVHN